MTQTALAGKIGITQPNLHAILSGAKSPLPPITSKLMRALKIRAPWSSNV